MLYLKAWNHIVYIIIPFAILGYGIGANVYLIWKDKINRHPERKIVGYSLFFISILTLISASVIVRLPVQIDDLINIFVAPKALMALMAAYMIFMLPFIFIGFLVVYYFTVKPSRAHQLYFFDLVGAGLGAALFFPLIKRFEIFHSLFILVFIAFLMGCFVLFERKKILSITMLFLIFVFGFSSFPEPLNYTVDGRKGWEWIPGYYQSHQYQQLASEWHPLGRTDIYRILDENVRQELFRTSPGTFDINLKPRPEFSYFSTNFLAGTPVYRFSQKGMSESGAQLNLFSQAMESPYILLNRPRVFIIGAGGGRDIFMAHTHGASEIVGAEINPGIVRAMSPGGMMYDYSGRVYTSHNAKIMTIDGRHLAKNLPPKSQDLIVLNGVDTFSGLSSGAYAYAESYLYTKNALIDFLKVLDDDGMINFNRWLFANMPRETLRLEAIALAALKEIGAEQPWDHIVIGAFQGWSLVLIKKTPFTFEDRQALKVYFDKIGIFQLYPAGPKLAKSNHPLSFFDLYVRDFKKNNQKAFEKVYPYDVSVITDDNPFFYKYYKFASFNPFKPSFAHHTGTVIFLSQAVILLQTVVCILLFIFLPLYVTKKADLKKMPPKSIGHFVLYFSCLGCGFMFIEIPFMQRFTLLLGSPIYAISVVLVAILVSAGIGSAVVPWFQKRSARKAEYLCKVTYALIAYVIMLVIGGTGIYDHFMSYAFGARIALVSMVLFPLGFLLGAYFPSGLEIIGRRHESAVAWAWGINCGFSVLGSILSIIIAQFSGFNFILLIACLIYLIGFNAFRAMENCFAPSP